MSTLLLSLGSTRAIVPEAFLFPDAKFDVVHVLTTKSIEESDVDWIVKWFAKKAPNTTLTITRVDKFTDLKSNADHFCFEEVLYRWILAKAAGEPAYVCLTGGFKTMSAAVQKAAAVLGAVEVFHVLCDLKNKQPATFKEIEDAKAGGHLHWIKLGPESGWPQLRRARAADYPLTTIRQEGCVAWVSAPDCAFRDRLREIVERSHHIAGAWERLGQLPFSVLATWPAADLDWLDQPVSASTDKQWLAALPKVELHCHLGGFATHGELLAQVRAAATGSGELPTPAEPSPPPGWPLPSEVILLKNYMKLGDANGSALLRDAGCLATQCQLLYEHLVGQNIVYAEIRCSPANYAEAGRSPWTVLSEIRSAFDACMAKAGSPPPCHVNLIIIATRREKGDYRTAISRHLALAVSAAEHWKDEEHCRVVGVDLAGYEDISTRAHYFREEFTAIHRCGLALTVHAGENDDAEGIWSAVFDLNARRLGHALLLGDSPELMRSVADRGIGVEMCPYANCQIKGFALPCPDPPAQPSAPYPLKRYLDEGIRVTVNTDNIGISAASLTENLLLAARLCPELSRMDMLRLQAHALDTAFLSPSQRGRFIARFSSLIRPAA